jgi:hypothetical protein
LRDRVEEGEMPAKAKRKAAKAPVKRAAKKPTGKAPAYVCGVCGYRLVVDRLCGCSEEHVMLCCGQPMKKTRA